MRARLALLALSLLPRLAGADGLTVLSVAKVAILRAGAGVVRVGRDPHLASPPSPVCPATSSVELSSYPVATWRVTVATHADLDCAKWSAKRGGFVYDDPAATGGVR